MFAFQVLPIVIFIASLFSVLYYFGVMQVFVRGMAVLMQRVMGASGADSTTVPPDACAPGGPRRIRRIWAYLRPLTRALRIRPSY